MPGLTGTALGQYQLLDRLGRGGMSEVYLAYDEEHNRNVAIKVVASIHADYIERFRREAYAVSTLQHAHILPAYDYGEQPPWHYMVMPYIELGTLRDRLMQEPLTLEETGMILEQIASALQFAHEQGIIHRDIKPSNILLRDDHYVYLADFGLAKSLDGGSTITQTGNLLGTPEYMAPELADGPATTSSDLYALGILLYEMATGQVPFSAETPLAVYWKQIREQPVPPTEINPAIPPAIERVILRSLEKEPQQRYQSANEMAQAYIEALTFPDAIIEDVPSRAENFPLSSANPVMAHAAPSLQVQQAANAVFIPEPDGQLLLPNNPVAVPTAIPPKRRYLVRRPSPYLLRRRRNPANPPSMESLAPSSSAGSAALAGGTYSQPLESGVQQNGPKGRTVRARPVRRRRTAPQPRRRRTNTVIISLAVVVILLLIFGLIAYFFTVQYDHAVHHTSTLGRQIIVIGVNRMAR